MTRFLSFAAISTLLALLSGCGYTLQTSQSPLTEREGIRKIYVEPIINNTYKAGVENTVYNALVRTLSVHRRVILVNSPDDADAFLRGNVTNASYAMNAGTSAYQLNPAGAVPTADIRANVQIATEYMATLMCSFTLVRPHPEAHQKAVVWTGGFTRTSLFDASNNLSAEGDTSALINESEFERALSNMASAMMDDLHESMLAMF